MLQNYKQPNIASTIIDSLLKHNCEEKYMRRVLRIPRISTLDSHDPILESTVDPLDMKNINKSLKGDIEILKHTAAHYKLVSLSANQIQMQHRLFAILKEPLIIPGQWSGYEHKENEYQIVINPVRIQETSIKFKDFEECPSLPGMRCAVWNPISQTYSFYSPKFNDGQVTFQKHKKSLQGFIARIWDHQIRHLDGFLSIFQGISHGQIYVSDDFRQNPGVHAMVELIKSQLKLMSKQSLKKFFQKPSAQGKEGIPLSATNLPDQLHQSMKNRFNKQYNKILDDLEEEAKKESTKK